MTEVGADLVPKRQILTKKIRIPGVGGQDDIFLSISEKDKAEGFIRPLRRSYLHDKCGIRSNMCGAIADTYARDLSFYTTAYCGACEALFPVGGFKWTPDGTTLGS